MHKRLGWEVCWVFFRPFFCVCVCACAENCFALHFLSLRIIFTRLQLNLIFFPPLFYQALDLLANEIREETAGPKWP